MTMTMTMTEKHYTSFLNEFDVVTGQDRIGHGQHKINKYKAHNSYKSITGSHERCLLTFKDEIDIDE